MHGHFDFRLLEAVEAGDLRPLRDPNAMTELEVLAAVRTRLETDSTTISLTDDLEDQGALRFVVLSPTTNLQGAFWDQEIGRAHV